MREQDKVRVGRYQGSGRGFGFFIPDGGRGRSDDCFVPPRKEAGAWDGDRVEAVMDRPDPREPGRRLARITQVVERTNRIVTGTICRLGAETWLLPDNDRLPGPIRITGKAVVRKGEKAAVAMASYGSVKHPPLGTLKETFGPAGTRSAAVEAILYQQDIQRDFPPAVRAEAETVPQRLTPADRKGRMDLRDKLTITIDGAASKDFDDAVSLETDPAGHWLLGVHIADVSHYVRPGSPLDQEAFHRGTSVYFADQVAPMLPEELSNGICSLNPRCDRLALSCLMTLDRTGKLLDYDIAPTVIRSHRRMTYEDCNALLEGGHPGLEKRYEAVLPMLREMAALSARLEQRRQARGSLELSGAEQAILCDEEGVPVAVEPRIQGVSEKLIESFMLIANETVAAHLDRCHKPAVYRIHEAPSEEKTENLKAMLAPLGIQLKTADHAGLRKVLEEVKGKPEAAAVNMMVLRAMMKARYDTENLGHFGLAAPLYCHFTAPIRRYPDLMVHRCLHALAEGKLTAAGEKKLLKACEKAAEQSSRRELAAQSAERDIEKLYLAEYMQGHLGETFPAAVSGVTKSGLFAALENGIEGFVPLECLPRDRYDYDEDAMTLTGRHSGRSYGFGQPLEVLCAAANPATGRIDFCLPETEGQVGNRPSEEEKPAPEPDRRSRRQRDHGHSRGLPHGGGKSSIHAPKGGKKRKKR